MSLSTSYTARRGEKSRSIISSRARLSTAIASSIITKMYSNYSSSSSSKDTFRRAPPVPEIGISKYKKYRNPFLDLHSVHRMPTPTPKLKANGANAQLKTMRELKRTFLESNQDPQIPETTSDIVPKPKAKKSALDDIDPQSSFVIQPSVAVLPETNDTNPNEVQPFFNESNPVIEADNNGNPTKAAFKSLFPDEIHRCPVCKKGLCMEPSGLSMKHNFQLYKQHAEILRQRRENPWGGKFVNTVEEPVVVASCGELYHKKCLISHCSTYATNGRTHTNLKSKKLPKCPRCKKPLIFSHYREIDAEGHRLRTTLKFDEEFNLLRLKTMDLRHQKQKQCVALQKFGVKLDNARKVLIHMGRESLLLKKHVDELIALDSPPVTAVPIPVTPVTAESNNATETKEPSRPPSVTKGETIMQTETEVLVTPIEERQEQKPEMIDIEGFQSIPQEFLVDPTPIAKTPVTFQTPSQENFDFPGSFGRTFGRRLLTLSPILKSISEIAAEVLLESMDINKYCFHSRDLNNNLEEFQLAEVLEENENNENTDKEDKDQQDKDQQDKDQQDKDQQEVSIQLPESQSNVSDIKNKLGSLTAILSRYMY